MASKLKVTWSKSTIGKAEDQKRTIKALGLKRLHHTVEHDDTPAVRGMTMKVRHLVTVEEVE